MHQELQILQEQQTELIRRYKALKEENNTLQQANQYQNQELQQTRNELALLQHQYRQLQAANALLGGDGEREYAKRKLTQLIALVDKALANNAEA